MKDLYLNEFKDIVGSVYVFGSDENKEIFDSIVENVVKSHRLEYGTEKTIHTVGFYNLHDDINIQLKKANLEEINDMSLYIMLEHEHITHENITIFSFKFKDAKN